MEKSKQLSELENLNKKIMTCAKCRLSLTRTNAVPGEGRTDSGLMIVGQSPGKNEDKTGRPFVGKAGEFLDKLLDMADIDRKNAYITSVIKCHPPKNRNPGHDEIRACCPYLREQIRIVRPATIILLRKYAISALLPTYSRKSISGLHGRAVRKDKIRYIPMYHPASGMRFPKIKKIMQEDFTTLISHTRKASLQSETSRQD